MCLGGLVLSIAQCIIAPRPMGTQLNTDFSFCFVAPPTCHWLEGSVTELGWGCQAGTCFSADN